jgi:PqqA peptide cyclase
MNGPPDPPLALLAELTHRCPLQCPYCSNPLALLSSRDELSTSDWKSVIDQAAKLGVLQIHFSGGEPMVRRDLEDLVTHAHTAGLYSNLITSGVLSSAGRLEALARGGLDHVQLSFQDAETESAERIGHMRGAQAKKIAFARDARGTGLPLTVNAVVHRQNLDRLEEIIDLALSLEAGRLEIAHVQYYGWALKNRKALMPSRAQIEVAAATVEQARARLKGRLVIDHVTPDYFARRPKACMGGWGHRFLNVAPSGQVLPCHAALSIPGMVFDNVMDRSLAEIWRASAAFETFRGTAWMPEPCRSCDQREIDWGGCRCQALAITGRADNVDPACELSPDHEAIVQLGAAGSASQTERFNYRRYPRRTRS